MILHPDVLRPLGRVNATGRHILAKCCECFAINHQSYDISVKFTVDESIGASISGGPLSESYMLKQLHLHWGSQQDQGAEHTVDGHRYGKSTPL